MDPIVRFFGSTQPIVVVSLIVTYAVVLQYSLSLQVRRRRERRASLLATVSAGLSNGTIVAFEDIVNVYKGIMKLGSEDLSYRVGLSTFLRDLLVEIVGGKVANKDRPTDLVALKNTVTAFLRQSEAESPFADLPAVEQNIISDISRFAETGDKSSVAQKLNLLASAIQVRAQEQARVEKLNRWSVPLAVAGLVLTVVFGILSLHPFA